MPLVCLHKLSPVTQPLKQERCHGNMVRMLIYKVSMQKPHWFTYVCLWYVVGRTCLFMPLYWERPLWESPKTRKMSRQHGSHTLVICIVQHVKAPLVHIRFPLISRSTYVVTHVGLLGKASLGIFAMWPSELFVSLL